MENGYNNGSSNNDYQFTRPENNASNYGGGYNNSGLDMTPMTMGEWIVTLIIMAIPCVNIISVLSGDSVLPAISTAETSAARI